MTSRRKGVKRCHISADTFESSNVSDVSNNSESSGTESAFCERRQQLRAISGKTKTIELVGCDGCDSCLHQSCTDIKEDVDVSSIPYLCYTCKSISKSKY